MHDLGLQFAAWLVRSTCAMSAAVVAVLLLRGVMRRHFGAGAAYALWMLVPAAWLAMLLPARQHIVGSAATAATQVLREAGGAAAAADTATITRWLMLAWVLGALITLVRGLQRQRRFVRSLGTLTTLDGGLLQAQSCDGLPAVIGLRPRIVLPADFCTRYSDAEQRLVLDHERVHLRRHDLLVNVALLAGRSVYWFNPLAWIGAACVRRDQELSCDAHVLARHPNERRAYGLAMLKTSLSPLPAPLACHWFGGHPLKERIAMLKQPVPAPLRVLSGAVVVALGVLGGGVAAWAAQAPVTVVRPVVAMQAVPYGALRFAAAPRPPAPPSAPSAPAPPPPPALPPLPALPVLPAPPAPPPPPANATPAPAYPAAALEQKQGGRVVLELLVGVDGRVKDAIVVESEPKGVFDAASLEAARKWTLAPTMEAGKPVEGRVRVPIDFDPAKSGEKATGATPGAA